MQMNEQCREQTARVLDLLTEQVRLYGELQTLTRKQQSLVAVEDTRPLLKLLSQRQRLIDQLQVVAGEFSPYRKSWEDVRACMTETERSCAEHLIEDANSRLAEIMKSDEEDARRLSVRKQAVGKGMSDLGSAKTAIAAYGGSRGDSARRFDQIHEAS